MVCYPKNDVYKFFTTKEGFPDPKYVKTLPLIAINTTHGTGTEADRWGVVSFPEKSQKLGTGHENMYPMYSIDDPWFEISCFFGFLFKFIHFFDYFAIFPSKF